MVLVDVVSLFRIASKVHGTLFEWAGDAPTLLDALLGYVFFQIPEMFVGLFTSAALGILAGIFFGVILRDRVLACLL